MTPQLAAALTALVVALVTGLTTWRVTRFLLLDSLLEPIRDPFEHWLARHESNPVIGWLGKLYTCAFCVSVWVAAGANLIWVLAVGGLGWLFLFTWLGAATIAMVVYRYIDPPSPCLPSRMCDEG